MARLGTAERAVFDAVRRSCYRGLVSAELRAAASQRLGEYLRADAYCGMELDPSIPLPVHAVSDGWPPEAHEPLLVHAVLASPTADPPRLLASGRRAVDVDELLGARRRDGDPYFTHHILPFGYRWEVQLLCAAHGTGRAFFTFNRTAAHGAFEPRQLRLLDAVAPHLAAGMAAATARERLDAPLASATGLVVLDEWGRVELANEVGEGWLRSDGSGDGSTWRMGLRLVSTLLARGQPDTPPVVDVVDAVDGVTVWLDRPMVDRPAGVDLPLQGLDPARPGDLHWVTIGGAVDGSESVATAAVREMREETGVVVDETLLVGPIHRGDYPFSWDGRDYLSDNHFFAVPLAGDVEVEFSGLDTGEVANIFQALWGSPEELPATGQAAHPDLPAIMSTAIAVVRKEGQPA
jgi:8-oxo-dGTP pyrophosphatase MutT (NUDIX family)